MIQLKDYIKAPCRSLSIPYWKQKNIKMPDNIKIVHDDDYVASRFVGYKDEPYFRLYHDLQGVGKEEYRDDMEIVKGTADMLDIFVEIINQSYSDLSVTKHQMESYLKTPAYYSDLWVLLKDKSEAYIGCGVADYDKEAGEMSLEWIQVIPSCRRRGYGQYIVNYLLAKMQGIAKFATVSGKLNNPTHPEEMYRKCGFTGNDIWHVLSK